MLHASWCWLREQCDLIDLINLYYVIFEFQWQNRKFFTFNFYNALTYKKEHLLMKQLLTLMYCGCSNKLWGKMEDSEVKQSKKWWHHLYQLSNDSFTHCTMFSHLVSILKKKNTQKTRWRNIQIQYWETVNVHALDVSYFIMTPNICILNYTM